MCHFAGMYEKVFNVFHICILLNRGLLLIPFNVVQTFYHCLFSDC